MPRRPRVPVPELIDRLEEVYGKPRFISRFDPMEELVSCILSQHTADANSFPAFTNLRETFATWQDVVDAGPEAVAPVIRRAGLANQKAKSIVACLRAIHEQNGDYTLENLRDMPMREGRKWLESLPGVGPKTASIVLCFSFGMGAIPVDTHVYRVSWRIGLISPKIDEKKAHDALLELVPPELAFRFHVALIQHGRQTCKAPFPDCERCTIREHCKWLAHDGPAKARKAAKSSRRRAKTA